jgi:hypothetical protein
MQIGHAGTASGGRRANSRWRAHVPCAGSPDRARRARSSRRRRRREDRERTATRQVRCNRTGRASSRPVPSQGVRASPCLGTLPGRRAPPCRAHPVAPRDLDVPSLPAHRATGGQPAMATRSSHAAGRAVACDRAPVEAHVPGSAGGLACKPAIALAGSRASRLHEAALEGALGSSGERGAGGDAGRPASELAGRPCSAVVVVQRHQGGFDEELEPCLSRGRRDRIPWPRRAARVGADLLQRLRRQAR